MTKLALYEDSITKFTLVEGEGRVGGPYLFYTSGFLPSVESRSVRPVVNIQADTIDTDTGDGTDSNVGWGIK